MWRNLIDIIINQKKKTNKQDTVTVYCGISLYKVQKQVKGITGIEVRAGVTFGQE